MKNIILGFIFLFFAAPQTSLATSESDLQRFFKSMEGSWVAEDQGDGINYEFNISKENQAVNVWTQKGEMSSAAFSGFILSQFQIKENQLFIILDGVNPKLLKINKLTNLVLEFEHSPSSNAKFIQKWELDSSGQTLKETAGLFVDNQQSPPPQTRILKKQ